MSKDMTEAEKARDYDRIYAALVEANQALGKQAVEVEQLRKRLAKHEPQKIANIQIEISLEIPMDQLFSDGREHFGTAHDVLAIIENAGLPAFLAAEDRVEVLETDITICIGEDE